MLLERELSILKGVDHPNIIKFVETYQDKEFFHIVMEFCNGGELFDRIIHKGKYAETDAATIIKKLLSAITHLHDRGICHRDIKPENLIFESKKDDAEIKLIDFGLSKYVSPHEKMHTKVGTPYYVAPEVLRGRYDK